MNRQPEAITITPEQIIAAAQKIRAAMTEEREQVSSTSANIATEHWLRCVIADILAEPEHYAVSANALGNFAFDPDCAHPGCRCVPRAHDIYCTRHSDVGAATGNTEKEGMAAQAGALLRGGTGLISGMGLD